MSALSAISPAIGFSITPLVDANQDTLKLMTLVCIAPLVASAALPMSVNNAMLLIIGSLMEQVLASVSKDIMSRKTPV